MTLIMGFFKISLSAMLTLTVSAVSHANEPVRRVVKDVPPVKNIYRVSASKTPSGFPVPRYVSLKVGLVNGRIGPSLKHSIAWQYKRKGLPLIVVAETDMWRKVRDIHGDESWVHKPALSGARNVILLDDAPLYAKPQASARVSAKAMRGTLMGLMECNDNQWCKIEAENGLKGWVQRYKIWGAQPLN